MLKVLLQDRFSKNSRLKGEAYFREGRVGEIDLAATSLYSEVKGGELYSVNFDWTDSASKIEVSCTCLHFADGNWCKHLWATVLAVEKANLVPGVMKRSGTSFLHTSQETEYLDWESNKEDRRLPNRGAYQPPSASTLHPWRYQLDRIRETSDVQVALLDELSETVSHPLSEILVRIRASRT